MGRPRRRCYYCGHEEKVRPSVALLGEWVCRDRDACDRRISAKSPYTKG